MTIGYKNISGVELDALFMAGNAGLTTGFKNIGGTDLGNLFYPYTTGAKVGATGFKNSGGVDFADLFQNASVPIFTVNVVDYYKACIRAGGATAGIYLINDGTVTLTATGESNEYSSWGTPTTGGAGASYWARFTYTGSAPSVGGGIGNWIQISSGSAYATLNANIAGQWKQSNLTLQIATDSGGANIIDTSYPVLYVEWPI